MEVRDATSAVYRVGPEAARADDDVPLGYKRTEVGVIPEDWEIMPLNLLFAFSGGISATRSQLGVDGYCYLHYGDIHTTNRTHVDVRTNFTDIPKLNVPLSQISHDALLDDGDVVFVDASEDEEGASKHIVVSNPDSKPFISGLHTIVAKPKTNKVAPSFRCYCFQSDAVKAQFRFFAVGTKVLGVSKSNIRRIEFPVPPIAEQQAIAEALSDADALIESLQQLNAKQRAIKQGAMQALLTGRQRLPGFTSEWRTNRIGEFTDCAAGGTPSTRIPEYWGGNHRWMNSGELNLKVVSEVEGRITDAGLRNSSTKEVPANCVLIGLAGQGKTRGTAAINTVALCTNQSIAAIFPSRAHISKFLYYVLDTRYEELRELSSGEGGRGGLNLTLIRNLEVPIPSVEEQTAIADVLSDMDAEIEALEARLAKTRVLKAGMMQQLLTGRIRLV